MWLSLSTFLVLRLKVKAWAWAWAMALVLNRPIVELRLQDSLGLSECFSFFMQD